MIFNNKFLVHKGLEGFGDRLQVLLQCIQYAKITNRTLVIDWMDKHWSIKNNFGFNHYLNIKNLKYISLDHFKKFNKNCTDVYPKAWTNKLFSPANPNNYNKKYSWDKDEIQNILNSKEKDREEKVLVIFAGTRTYIYKNINYLGINKNVLRYINYVFKSENLIRYKYKVIHIRVGDKHFFNGNREAKTCNKLFMKKKLNYFNYLFNLYKKNKDNMPVIIITDNQTVSKEFIQKYKIGRLLKDRIEVKNKISGIHKNQDIKISKERLNFELIADFCILIYANKIINDNDSTFSQMAKKCKKWRIFL